MKKKKCNYKNVFKQPFETTKIFMPLVKSEEDFLEFILKEQSVAKEDQFSMALLVNFYMAEKEKFLEHLFIQDDSLFDFFKNTKIKVSDGLEKLLKENADKYFVVHSKTQSFGFTVHKNENKYAIAVFDEGKSNEELLTSLCKWRNLSDNEACRKAVNLLFYMTAFPEKVRNGIPDDYRSVSVGSTKNKVIGKSERIISHSDCGKSTHFRSGFFRYYPKDSQHWKNVAGTSIWVDATVVNGKAKTIKE